MNLSRYFRGAYRLLNFYTLLYIVGLVQVDGLVFDSSKKGPPKSPPAPLKGEALLKSLDIQSSTEPVLAGVQGDLLLQVPNLLSATAPAILRAASGVFAQDYKLGLRAQDDSIYSYVKIGDSQQVYETGIYKPPKKPIILYEFESCPFCRKVREACSMLSLEVTFRPTPRNGRRYRKEIKDKYGAKATFPFMVDPNNGAQLFESDDIIKYLFTMYGNGQVPWTLSPGSPLVPLTAGLGVGLCRLGAGGSYRESNPPVDGDRSEKTADKTDQESIILWAYEGSPFCKVVRERLCEYEIPHTVIYTPRGSVNRQKLFDKTGGRFQVPFLEDRDTEVTLFESEAINEYLDKQYGRKKPQVQYL